MNVEHLIQSGGLLLIGAIVFAESGLLVGFFLPGDTLLFSAGFFASQGELPILGLMAVVMTAAIVGDNVGYEIGKRNGHRIFRKKDGLFFRHEHIARAEAFYEKHGGKTVILARFIPVVRTFAPVVAGVGKMSHRRFLAFNIVGGVLWGGGVSLLGYWLGSKIPNIDKYIYPIIGLAVALSVLPALHHLLGDKEVRQKLINKLRKKTKR
ncbi:MAG TPA: VTT domain-containing protein [Candidatus Saccharibacteria bacterium]|nr:VTT domain-containing protein [Candidatus Saccharibacteria bacterium]